MIIAENFSEIGTSRNKNKSNKLSKKASGPPIRLTTVLGKHSVSGRKQYSKP